MVITYTYKKFGLHVCEEFPTEIKFCNSIDDYAVAMMKDSGDNVTLEFQSSLGSDPACFTVNIQV